MSLSVEDIMQAANKTANDRGWYNRPRSFPEVIALIHAEASEALEAYRDGMPVDDLIWTPSGPQGVPVELADVVIRTLDYCEHEAIDIVTALRSKLCFNQTRDYRHGGKVI